MRARSLKLWLVAAFMAILMPCGVNAAGLGQLTVRSGLGQPLNAEIELVAVKRGETITARLAPPDVYSQANAQLNPALAGTRITVEKRANGELYLRATSPRPVQEPFLELIVELNSESGRVTRQYTALLDPPGYGRGAEIPPKAEAPPAPAETPREQAPDAAARPAPVAPPKEASARPPSAAPSRATPAAGATPGEYGPVKPGETLSGIARIVKPDGATVEQTLVALHRQNPDAFIRKNMNLVKSGRILKVPDAAEISALPQPEAVREVRVQVDDFKTYRDQLAERAAPASEEGSATRGRIGTAVTDSATGPRDTVRVSRGEPPGKGAPKGTPEDRIRILEEEAIARQGALAEASDRIGQLEKMIKDMQRLAELRTSGAPAAQKGSESSAAKAPSAEKAPASVSGPIAPPRVEQSKAAPAPSKSAKESPRLPSESPSASQGASPVTSAGTPVDASGGPVAALPPQAAAPKAAPVPAPEPSGSFLDDLLAEPMYLLAGAAVVLLALFGLISARRRRAARVTYDMDDDDKVAPTFTASSALMGGGTRPSPAATATGAPSPQVGDTRITQLAAGGSAQPSSPPRPRAPTTDNDLDFDLTPGRAAPASPATPLRETKPAAAAAEPKAATLATAPVMPPQRDVGIAAAGPKAPSVATAPAPASSATAPGPALSTADAKASSIVTAPAAAPSTAGSPAVRETSTQPASPVAPAAALGAALASAPARGPSPSSQSTPAPEVSKPQSPDLTTGAAKPAAEVKADSPKASNLIDFDLDPPPPARPTLDSTLGERVSSDPPPREFEFKLDLDGLDLPTPADATKAAPAAKDAHWYDVQQKFDLAKAYQEMGDRDGARDILREVLKEGDQDQRTQATQLIAKLG